MRDRITELRRRERAILDTAVEIERTYPSGEAMPPDEAAWVEALLRLLDRLSAERERLEAEWNRDVIACDFRSLSPDPELEYRLRLHRLNERERPVTQEVIDAYTKTFGSERAPDLWHAMKDGC